MILIAHRGNLQGPEPENENHPEYLEKALNEGYDVEVDVWLVDGELKLGHDKPQYDIDWTFFTKWKRNLWVHCKNVEAIHFLKPHEEFNYFWHENDTVTLTSHNFIWAFPGKQPIKDSIAVMPELHNDDLSQCIGVCSDYLLKYKK